MRSIERRFNQLQAKNQGLSSYINFAKAIKGQRFNRKNISQWFGKLVDQDDYNLKDRKKLIDQLEALSNPA